MVWSDEPGRYGEPKGWRVLGVELNGVVTITRIHEWTIEKKSDCDDGQKLLSELQNAIKAEQHSDNEWRGFEFKSAMKIARPWSSVNNCTDSSSEQGFRT